MPWEYACVAEKRDVCTFIFEKDGKDIAGANYSIKHAPGNIITIADVLSGFVFREEPSVEVLSFLLEHFFNWAHEKKVAYARITPWLPKSQAGEITTYASWVPDVFKTAGMNPIAPGRHTYWIDLTMSEDQILSTMKKQTRYNIRKASRQGVEIKKYTKPCKKLFEEFWHLYKRDHQETRSYLKTKKRVELDVIPMLESGLGSLYFAEFYGKMLSVTFVSNFGQSASIHTGISPEVSNKNCPSPGHLLRWEIIRDLKRLGNKIHDMGFCPGPIPIKEHPMYGIWHFKHSFGGDHVEFLPTYGKVLRQLSGRIFKYLMYRK